jgi:hypothetical protein
MNLIFFSLIPIIAFGGTSTKPYSDIKFLLPYTERGYFNDECVEAIKRIIKKNKVKTVIEVGSQTGNTTCFIADNLPKDGVVYAVDEWLGSLEYKNGDAQDYNFVPTLYDVFLSNVMQRGLTKKIVPFREDSISAAKDPLFKKLDKTIDLIIIYSNQIESSTFADIEAWYPFVEGHGIMAGNNYNWINVKNAVDSFAIENNLKVISSGTFWKFIEKRKKI